MKCWKRGLVTALFVLSMVSVMVAEAADVETETYTVQPGPFKVEVELSGTFVSQSMTEVSRDPEEWGQMKVLWAAAPGAVVKQGDPLVKLDVEDLDRSIEDAQTGQKVAAVELQKARHELSLLEESTPEELKWAERARRVVDEDFAYNTKMDDLFRDKTSKYDQMSRNIWHESVKLEHEELTKMYTEDDLVEATEKIVLMQQDVRLAVTMLDKERWDDYEFPRKRGELRQREIESRDKGKFDARLAFDRATAIMPLALERKRLDVAKMERDFERAELKMRKLKADRSTMTITAPADGMVYYGQSVRGDWASAVQMADKLRPGGSIGARDVFMTIVDPANLFVRAAAEEKDLWQLEAGLKAKVAPTGYPKKKIGGKVSSVTIIPCGPGPYTVNVDLDGDTSPVLPGMTCSVKVTAYRKHDAITVPAAAVHSEEADEDEQFVYIMQPDGERAKRSVTVGRENDGKLEIVSGLAAGDVVVVDEPGE